MDIESTELAIGLGACYRWQSKGDVPVRPFSQPCHSVDENDRAAVLKRLIINALHSFVSFISARSSALINIFYYFGVQGEERINIKAEVKEEEETYVGGDQPSMEEVGMIMKSEEEEISPPIHTSKYRYYGRNESQKKS